MNKKQQEGECSLHLTLTSYHLRQFEQSGGCLEVATVEDDRGRRGRRRGPCDGHGVRHLAESPATDSRNEIGMTVNRAAVCFLGDINGNVKCLFYLTAVSCRILSAPSY